MTKYNLFLVLRNKKSIRNKALKANLTSWLLKKSKNKTEAIFIITITSVTIFTISLCFNYNAL